MMMLWIALGLLVFAWPVEAATLYVNNSGSPGCDDATVKASNSAGSPWCTIGRASWGNATRATPSSGEAAAAGDIVSVTAGTYSTSQGSEDDNDSTYSPVNSGSAGNLITFRASGTVTLTYTGGTWGAMIGANGVDYIKWDGFTIDEANAPAEMDSGAATLNDTTGSIITNCRLIGNLSGKSPAGATQDHNSNHSGIRFNLSTDITASNNTISNYYTTVVNGENGNGVESYDSYGITIEHNTIYDTGSGIFIKQHILGALNGTNRIRLNKITDSGPGGGITLHRFRAGSHVYHVTQNLIRNAAGGGIKFRDFDGTDGPRNISVVNNTIVGTLAGGAESGLVLRGAWPTGDAANFYYNNLVYNTSSGLYSETQAISIASDAADIDIEHNVYYSVTNVGSFSGTTYTLATWKSGSGQDQAAPAASTSDPVFVNAGTHDYRLQGSSPFLTQGVDILDLDGDASTSDAIPVGAYITGNETIGFEGAVVSGPRFVPGFLKVAEVQP
jgi:Right handed beta helix region